MTSPFCLVSPCLLLVAACGGTGVGDESTGTAKSSLVDTASADGRGRAHDRDRVYTLTNDPIANEVVVYAAGEDGSLREVARVPTSGLGSGDGLGSQGAVTLTRDGRWLLAVNAGSSELSLFRVRDGALDLSDIEPSGGERPISVTEANGLVYVLNAGGAQNVSGFRIDHGALRALPRSSRALSAATPVGPAQVQLSPSGDALVVTEKATNDLDTFVVRFDGTLTDAVVTASSGMTPFGFAFDPRGVLIVSDAFGGAPGAGALSSYALDPDAVPALVTGPVPNQQAAPCWVVTTPDGRFAYTSNTASGTVSGYAIGGGGALTLFPDLGVTGTTGDGSKPADMALGDEGRILYVRNGGTGSIAAFHVNRDGGLEVRGRVTGLPANAAGLAAR